MDLLESSFRKLQFKLRSKVLGNLRLRSGLPDVSRSQTPLGLFGAQKQFDELGFYHLVLNRAFAHSPRKPDYSNILDIGCRNWSYLRALVDFFPHAKITGIEVDGNWRLWNLYRRKDYALSYVKEAKSTGRSVEIIFDDFRKFHPQSPLKVPLFCFFFPFLSENPCLKWGLPLEFNDFAGMLNHAQSLAKGRGGVISLHQGDWEAELASRSYERLGFETIIQEITPEEFSGKWPGKYSVFIFTAQMPSSS